MKNLNIKRFALTIFVVYAICACWIAYRSGKNITSLWDIITSSYKTLPLVLIFITLFVSYAWRWKVFRSWLVPFPDLNGTWQGTIQTTWENPKTGAIPPPIPVILSIKQSFTQISCVMRTAEMTSRSYLADFWLNGDEQIRMLGYSYHSKPLPTVVERSQPHDGTIVFEIIEVPAKKLKGTYWTARKTTGEINLTYREPGCLEEFPSDLGEHPVSGKV